MVDQHTKIFQNFKDDSCTHQFEVQVWSDTIIWVLLRKKNKQIMRHVSKVQTQFVFNFFYQIGDITHEDKNDCKFLFK